MRLVLSLVFIFSMGLLWSQNEFITTWKTDNAGTSGSTEITIPTNTSDHVYNYDVDWDNDGTFDEFGLTGDVTHDFGAASTYTIRIQGAFPQFYFNNGGDREKILDVAAWGDVQWLSGERAFFGCSNLDITASDTIDVSLATDFSRMFRACTNLNSPNLINWDVSTITTMFALFRDCPNFNQDISGWNVSNNENFTYLFSGASDFNQNIGGWNMSNATVMQLMFNNATEFNQDIGGWDVGNVTTMRAMFLNASEFNQDISGWDVSKVVAMEYMFQNTASFDQNLGSWVIDSVMQMNGMFLNVTLSSDNYDSILMGWGSQSITNIVFSGGNSEYCHGDAARDHLVNNLGWTITDGGQNCTGQEFITTWQTDNPGTSGTTEITIPTSGTYDYDVDWDNDGVYDEFGLTGDVTHDFGTAGTYTIRIKGDFPRIYFNSTGDKDKIISVDQWGTIAWTSFSDAFENCDSLVVLAIDAPDLSGVTNLQRMFANCGSLSNEDFSGWNTSSITNMRNLFSFSGFTGNISNWDVALVQNFQSMFYGTSFNGDVSNWVTSSADDMGNMFRSNNSFNQDVSGWDVSNVVDFSTMFAYCNNFNADVSGWDVSSSTDMGAMFRSCTVFDQDLGNWDVSTVSNFFAFLNGTNLSIDNYDSLLIGWSQLTLTAGLDFDAGGLRYCAGDESRDSIISQFGWTFSDGVKKCYANNLVITVQTDNGGTSSSTSFELPIFGVSNAVDIDWDNDGTYDDFGVTGAITHDYGTAGTYTVSIAGNVSGIYFNNSGDREKLLSIDQWGDAEWDNAENAFYGCTNLQVNATDTLEIYEITSLAGMFRSCNSLNASLDGWETDAITDMSFMFADCESFDQDLNDWDVKNVVSMESMFQNCISLNQDFEDWSTDDVQLLTNMFNGATLFDGDITKFAVDNVTDASGMLTNTSFQTYYDLLLNRWEEHTVQSNVTFDAGFATYCHGEHAHDSLTMVSNWTINDGGLSCAPGYELITTWQTDSAGTSNSSSITFSVYNSSTNYDVDWDNDGVYDTLGIQGDFVHDFGTPGTYTIRVKGWVPFVHFGNAGDKDKIISVDQWGDMPWTDSYQAFYGCSNLQINATDEPNMDAVDGLTQFFRNCTSLNSNINHWDVSHMKGFGYTFAYCDSLNQPFDNWDMSNVGSLRGTFLGAKSFNQDLSSWDVSNVTIMEDLFQETFSFNQNLGGWDVSNVIDIDGFFFNAGISTINYDSLLIGWSQLNLQPGLTFTGGSSQYCAGEEARDSIISQFGWTMNDSGLECSTLDHFVMTVQTNNSGTSSSTQMTIPTSGSYTYNYDVDWDNDGVFDSIGVTGDITHDYGVAGNYTIRIQGDFPAIRFNNEGDRRKMLDIAQWGTIQWETMSRAFWGCTNLLITATDEPDLSQVTAMDRMLRDCNLLVTGNLSDWDVSTIETFHRTFQGSARFNEDLSSWITSSATNMAYMFLNTKDYNQDMSNWDVSNVTAFQLMFNNCDSVNQDLSNWVTSSAINMNAMFSDANNFNGDISTWNTSLVTNFSGMFNNAASFDQDISNWNISSLTNAGSMFNNVTLSTTNYDNLLIGWGQQLAQNGVTFSGGNSMYCAGEAYRDTLIQTYGWSITDGGPDDFAAPVADVATLADITSVCEVTSLIAPTATDNCAATVTVTNDVVFPITEGTTIVTWTYDDGHGNTSVQTQNVIVDDVTQPVPDQASLADITSVCEVTSLTAPTAADNCAAAVTVTNDVVFPITEGTTLVTWTYDDGHGNTVTQTQNVIVDDVTQPVPDSVSLQDIITECEITSLSAPTATDNCTASVIVSNDAVLPISTQGTTVVTWTYDDGHGNTVTQTQNVILNDVTPPTASNPFSLSVACTSDVPAPNEAYVTDEADNCSGTPTVAFISEISDGLSCPETITRTYRVTDAVGLFIDVTHTIVVNDDVSPVLDNGSLQDISSYCPVTPTAPTATDNCTGVLNGVADVSFPINAVGTTTVTWTYTDDCGNTATQTQDITIEEIESGTYMASDGVTIVASNNDAGVTFQWVECHNNYAPIAGETNQNFTPSYGGDFAVIVTQDGCSDTSDCVNSIVGLEDIVINEVLLYPNPSTGNFTVQSDVSIVSLTMLDLSGREVPIESNLVTGEVRCETISTGTYLLQVSTAQTSHTLEVMIR